MGDTVVWTEDVRGLSLSELLLGLEWRRPAVYGDGAAPRAPSAPEPSPATTSPSAPTARGAAPATTSPSGSPVLDTDENPAALASLVNGDESSLDTSIYSTDLMGDESLAAIAQLFNKDESFGDAFNFLNDPIGDEDLTTFKESLFRSLEQESGHAKEPDADSVADARADTGNVRLGADIVGDPVATSTPVRRSAPAVLRGQTPPEDPTQSVSVGGGTKDGGRPADADEDSDDESGDPSYDPLCGLSESDALKILALLGRMTYLNLNKTKQRLEQYRILLSDECDFEALLLNVIVGIEVLNPTLETPGANGEQMLLVLSLLKHIDKLWQYLSEWVTASLPSYRQRKARLLGPNYDDSASVDDDSRPSEERGSSPSASGTEEESSSAKGSSLSGAPDEQREIPREVLDQEFTFNGTHDDAERLLEFVNEIQRKTGETPSTNSAVAKLTLAILIFNIRESGPTGFTRDRALNVGRAVNEIRRQLKLKELPQYAESDYEDFLSVGDTSSRSADASSSSSASSAASTDEGSSSAKSNSPEAAGDESLASSAASEQSQLDKSVSLLFDRTPTSKATSPEVAAQPSSGDSDWGHMYKALLAGIKAILRVKPPNIEPINRFRQLQAVHLIDEVIFLQMEEPIKQELSVLWHNFIKDNDTNKFLTEMLSNFKHYNDPTTLEGFVRYYGVPWFKADGKTQKYMFVVIKVLAYRDVPAGTKLPPGEHALMVAMQMLHYEVALTAADADSGSAIPSPTDRLAWAVATYDRDMLNKDPFPKARAIFYEFVGNTRAHPRRPPNPNSILQTATDFPFLLKYNNRRLSATEVGKVGTYLAYAVGDSGFRDSSFDSASFKKQWIAKQPSFIKPRKDQLGVEKPDATDTVKMFETIRMPTRVEIEELTKREERARAEQIKKEMVPKLFKSLFFFDIKRKRKLQRFIQLSQFTVIKRTSKALLELTEDDFPEYDPRLTNLDEIREQLNDLLADEFRDPAYSEGGIEALRLLAEDYPNIGEIQILLVKALFASIAGEHKVTVGHFSRMFCFVLENHYLLKDMDVEDKYNAKVLTPLDLMYMFRLSEDHVNELWNVSGHAIFGSEYQPKSATKIKRGLLMLLVCKKFVALKGNAKLVNRAKQLIEYGREIGLPPDNDPRKINIRLRIARLFFPPDDREKYYALLRPDEAGEYPPIEPEEVPSGVPRQESVPPPYGGVKPAAPEDSGGRAATEPPSVDHPSAANATIPSVLSAGHFDDGGDVCAGSGAVVQPASSTLGVV